jgi:phytoene synthase
MSPLLRASYESCRRVAAREARNFYPSFLLLPRDKRRSMCALYAFMRQTDDIGDEPGESSAKTAALDAWRRSLDATLAGAADASGWPGWLAVADTVARHGIPATYLHAVIDGVAMDLEPRRFETFDELRGYCYKVASAVGLCCLHVWGYRSEDGRAEGLAEACGVALQITNIIRDVAEDAQRGRVYLPQEDLRRFGVAEADLTAAAVGEPLRRLLEFEAKRAYHEYEAAAGLEVLVDPAGRPMLRAIVGIYRTLLDEIARRRYEVLAGRVSVPGWRKGWIALRAYAGLRPAESRGR